MDEAKEDEEKQFKKIKYPWPDDTSFRKTRKKLLEEHPELMTGIPKEMRWSPERPVERSKWEETAKKWREESKVKRPRNRTLKRIFIVFGIGFITLVILYLFVPEIQIYIDKLISPIIS